MVAARDMEEVEEAAVVAMARATVVVAAKVTEEVEDIDSITIISRGRFIGK